MQKCTTNLLESTRKRFQELRDEYQIPYTVLNFM